MTGTAVDVDTGPDGTLTVRPRNDLAAEDADELRRVIVHAVRRVRPRFLMVDLLLVRDADPIIVGVLAASCDLADDDGIAVMLANASESLARRLEAAGVAHHRLHRVRPNGQGPQASPAERPTEPPTPG